MRFRVDNFLFVFQWFLVTVSAHATLGNLALPRVNSQIKHFADFLPGNSTLLGHGLPLEILMAIPRLEILGARCSVAVVSDQGHLLTAGHCVERCLDAQSMYVKKNGILALDIDRLPEVRCQISVNGQPMQARVLAVNLCPSDAWLKDPKALQICGAGDYALLELIGKHSFRSSCFQVSRRRAGPGQTVLAIGYPQASHRAHLRPGALDSDGRSQYISIGQILRPSMMCKRRVADSEQFSGFDLYPRAFQSDSRMRLIMQEVEQGRILQASNDILKGNSGGALIGRYSAKLVGVASFMMSNHHDAHAECEGSGFFTSSAYILDHISRFFPKALGGLVCRERSFIRARP